MTAITKTERLVNIRPFGFFDHDMIDQDDHEIAAELRAVFYEILPESVAEAAIRGVLNRLAEIRGVRSEIKEMLLKPTPSDPSRKPHEEWLRKKGLL